MAIYAKNIYYNINNFYKFENLESLKNFYRRFEEKRGYTNCRKSTAEKLQEMQFIRISYKEFKKEEKNKSKKGFNSFKNKNFYYE